MATSQNPALDREKLSALEKALSGARDPQPDRVSSEFRDEIVGEADRGRTSGDPSKLVQIPPSELRKLATDKHVAGARPSPPCTITSWFEYSFDDREDEHDGREPDDNGIGDDGGLTEQTGGVV